MKLYFKLALRNILRNKKRTWITIISIFIAVFLALITRSMQLGAYAHVIDNVAGKYTGYVQVHAKGYWEEKNLDHGLVYTDSLKRVLKNTKGVIDIVPRLESYSLLSFGKQTKPVFINGLDPTKEKQLYPIDKRLVNGEVFGPNEKAVLIGKGMASFLHLKPKDSVYLIGQGYHGMMAAGKYEVKGIFDMNNEELNRSLIMLPLPVLQDYLSAPNLVTNLIVVKNNNTKAETLKKRLSQSLSADKYEVMTWSEMLPELHQAILADNIGGLYMIGVLYLIIAFGIFSTVLMMTQERIFEFGLLTAIGMKKWKTIFSLWIETLALSLIGLFIGLLAAYPIIYYFHIHPLPLPSDKADVMKKYGFMPEIPFSTDWHILLNHSALILFISMLAALYPTIIILNLHPLKAMHKK